MGDSMGGHKLPRKSFSEMQKMSGIKSHGGEESEILGGDTTKLDKLATELSKYAKSMHDCYTTMFGIIDGMENGVWSGEVYNAFKTHGDQYREAVMTYAVNLELYSSIFENASIETQSLYDEVSELVVYS